MSEWIQKSLGEITSYLAKGIPPKYVDELNENTIYVLNQKCNRDFVISYEQARIHDLQQKKVSEEKMIKPGDVLINSTGEGTAGRIAQIWDIPHPTTTDGHMILIRPTEEVDKLYYGYAVKANQVLIESLAEGSTGQTEVNKKRLQDEVIISFPVDKEEQHRIALMLEDIDRKIAINNQINRNLYEQAVALFESMYQDYSERKIGELDIFVTDYVANGSFASLKENVSILEEKDYAYFIRNVDLKAKEFPRFVNQHSYEFLSKSKLVGGEVIISNVGDVGSVFLCPKLDGPMTLGNNMIMLTSPKHNNYLYLFFKSYIGQGKIDGITGGSAQPKFNKTDFKSLEINYPDDSQVDEFNEKTSALLDMISKLDEENKRLTALRDSLLPKLMSGELDVSNLDI